MASLPSFGGGMSGTFPFGTPGVGWPLMIGTAPFDPRQPPFDP
jgi:hypothetical protein